MLISKDWLQTYFDQKLPDAERIADVLNFHAFEIEEIKAWDTDEILNVKVLADRACYALCHRGIASEISAGAIMKMKNFPTKVVKEEIKKNQKLILRNQAFVIVTLVGESRMLKLQIRPTGFGPGWSLLESEA